MDSLGVWFFTLYISTTCPPSCIKPRLHSTCPTMHFHMDTRRQSSDVKQWALSILLKIPKTLKQKQMVWTSFFANVSRNCWISEQTIQLKISEILGGKSNGMEIPSKKFLESLYTTQFVWLSRNSGKCCSIYYCKLHGKHTIFQWIESAHNFCVIYIIF